jgi:hypothetical protein
VKSAVLEKAENRSHTTERSSFKRNEDASLARVREIPAVTTGSSFDFGKVNVFDPKNTVSVQPKLQINQPGDKYEQEADAMADRVMRMSDTETLYSTSSNVVQRKCAHCEKEEEETLQKKESGHEAVSVAPAIVHNVLNSSTGKSMDNSTRSFMEQRFRHDFSTVLIHDDSVAHQSSKDINALAYTYGSHVVFGAGQFQPKTYAGKRLIAHELTHVVQQQANFKNAPVQRDVKAYYKEQTEATPNFNFSGGSSSYEKHSAEAQKLHDALKGLIDAGRVAEVKSTSNEMAWFAANHKKNAQLEEIKIAIAAVGISNATALAKAIYDIHSEYVYSQGSLITIAPFYSNETKFKSDLNRNNSREMTEFEIAQAQRVFKAAINYSKVKIEERSKVASVGGYARTIGNTINFPDEVRSMHWLIHELTHVWQYQTTGWTYAPKALWAQTLGDGYQYRVDGKTKEQSLIDARAAGRTLADFNKEQQGDIIADYFSLLQSGGNSSAYQPFINDIK